EQRPAHMPGHAALWTWQPPTQRPLHSPLVTTSHEPSHLPLHSPGGFIAFPLHFPLQVPSQVPAKPPSHCPWHCPSQALSLRSSHAPSQVPWHRPTVCPKQLVSGGCSSPVHRFSQFFTSSSDSAQNAGWTCTATLAPGPSFARAAFIPSTAD